MANGFVGANRSGLYQVLLPTRSVGNHIVLVQLAAGSSPMTSIPLMTGYTAVTEVEVDIGGLYLRTRVSIREATNDANDQDGNTWSPPAGAIVADTFAYVFSGIDATTPVNAVLLEASASDSPNIQFPAINTTTDGTAILLWGAHFGGDPSPTTWDVIAPSGFTPLADTSGAYDLDAGAAGSKGPFSVLASTSSTAGPSFAFTLALNPAGSGGPPTLPDLTLTNATCDDNVQAGDMIGVISNQTNTSTISLVDDDGGNFSLSGSNIMAAQSWIEAGTHTITLRETLAGATNTPHDTDIDITVEEGPIAFCVGSATGTTTAAIPSHQIGDAIAHFAYRDGSTTLPTLPSGQGWTDKISGAANTNAARLATKIADSTGETGGTFTSATSSIVEVWRCKPGYTLEWGAVAQNGGASTTVNYPALTLEDTGGNSNVLAFAGHRSTNTNLQNPPTGMVNRVSLVDGTDEAAAHDTDGGVTSWTSKNVSVGGTSSGYRSIVVELKVIPDASGEEVIDDVLSMVMPLGL